MYIIAYSDYKIFINFNFLIKTNRLVVFYIRNKRLIIFELIYNLHEKKLNNKEILEYLNNKNLITFRTIIFTHQS